MNKYRVSRRCFIIIIVLHRLVFPAYVNAQSESISIHVHLRGVYETQISLVTLGGANAYSEIIGVNRVKNGETVMIDVPGKDLPGEFVLQFDFIQNKGGTTIPAEKKMIINDQDLDLWINPAYANDPDSAWFQSGERENTGYASFLKDNHTQSERLAVLQQFLMQYDDTRSKFYRQCIEEYEHQRKQYNEWLNMRKQEDKSYFFSNLYMFYRTPSLSWEGTQNERTVNVISHYLDEIDFNNPVVTKTGRLREWMDNYVNLHLQMATTTASRDSLIMAAATSAIEKSKPGHACVYGWMVDYFYRGFESNNITAGMKVLEPYINDPACLTSRRMEIQTHLEGMKTLVAGSKAPDIEFKGTHGDSFKLYDFKPSSSLILLLFWSADCSHCIETIDSLSPWLQLPENKKQIAVVAISLDATEAEVKAWKLKKDMLTDWKHLRAEQGFQSKVAEDYFILSTPVMVLIDAATKKIIGMPASLQEMIRLVE